MDCRYAGFSLSASETFQKCALEISVEQRWGLFPASTKVHPPCVWKPTRSLSGQDEYPGVRKAKLLSARTEKVQVRTCTFLLVPVLANSFSSPTITREDYLRYSGVCHRILNGLACFACLSLRLRNAQHSLAK